MKTLDTGRNRDRNEVSRQFALDTFEESLAVQSQKDEADINLLVKRFGVVGLAEQNIRRPTYGDFTGVESYQDAMNALIEAQKSFMSLDAETRHKFHNDPAEFVDFCSKEENLEEMRKMGLAVPEPEKEYSLRDVVETLKETRYGDDGPIGSNAGTPSEAPARGAQGNGGAAGRGVPGSAPGGSGSPPGGAGRR